MIRIILLVIMSGVAVLFFIGWLFAVFAFYFPFMADNLSITMAIDNCLSGWLMSFAVALLLDIAISADKIAEKKG